MVKLAFAVTDNVTAALGRPSRLPSSHKEFPMFDLVMLALGLGFFVLSIGYAYACERL